MLYGFSQEGRRRGWSDEFGGGRLEVFHREPTIALAAFQIISAASVAIVKKSF